MPAPEPWANNNVDLSGPNGAGPEVFLLHGSVAGRGRFKVKGLYRSRPLQEFLQSRLAADRSIQSVSANLLTGNILIRFEPAIPAGDIALRLQYLLERFRGVSPRPAGEKAERKLSYPPGKLRKLVQRAEHPGERPWHVMEGEKVAAFFGTSPETGLADASLKHRFTTYGPNLLPEAVPRSRLSILIKQLNSLPVVLLGGSALLSIATGGIPEAVVIAAVIAINAAVGYATESRSEATIDSLKGLVRPFAVVRRDGRTSEIKGEEVVPGDLLVLRPGIYIAADARIVESRHLSVDESSLTGESMPAAKRSLPLTSVDLPLADRTNMAYQGTLVTGGQGAAVVVGTGRFSELGRLQRLAGEAKSPKTPMERELEGLGNRLVAMGGGICAALFAVGLARGYGLLPMLKTSISLAVAAIPEGLPAIATTVLAIGVGKMRKEKVVIRRLNAVETLGCVQSICLDKTGTLTFNRMTVVAVDTGEGELGVENGVLVRGGAPVSLADHEGPRRLLEACALCNESEPDHEGAALRASSTEGALLSLAASAGIDVNRLRLEHPLAAITYRSESRNYLITRHAVSDPGRSDFGLSRDQKMLLLVKGSPNEVMARCSRCISQGELRPLTDEERLAVELANERMAGKAWRVLGAACAHSEQNEEDAGKDLIWLGLVAMADPVKPGTGELIQRFHAAGIDTLMITGDQVPTAFAIGRELGLNRNGAPLNIFDSTGLKEMDPALLQSVAERVHIFARVSPSQKLQIVQALQRGGRVVAMTGDGVNDSPALKAADIGIAMGKAGTDVAREVADVVLEDDELMTMMVAVHHGRAIYSNIRKSLHFLLATNLTEVMVMSAALTFGLGQPLSAMQLLWINLISDIFPGLALSFELPDPDLLERPPRDPRRPIVDREDLKGISREAAVITAGALAAYLYGLARYGKGGRGAGTLAFTTLTSGQLLHALSCRSDRPTLFEGKELPPNRFLGWALGGSFALQAATVFIPALRRFLGLSPLRAGDWAAVGAGAVLPLILNEASKTQMTGANR